MGTSLGLGQGTEYQFFNAPQPTQGIPMLRQARLQQLREERMRRQQRRMKPDVTSMISFKGKQRPPEGRLPYPAVPEQMSPPGARELRRYQRSSLRRYLCHQERHHRLAHPIYRRWLKEARQLKLHKIPE